MAVASSNQDAEVPRPVTAKGAGVKRNRSGELTRQKIIEAAEKVFAEKGVVGASLREIMIAAGVNIAAVNYYFGSKADLLEAVTAERTSTMNASRIALLDAARARNGGVLTVEDWLSALVAPFIEAKLSSDPGWKNFLSVLNWLAVTRDPEYQKVVAGTYNSLRRAFKDALAEILPELSAEEISWRFASVIAVLRASLVERHRIAALTPGVIDPDDYERIMSIVLPFLAAGLRLPPVHPKPPVN